MIKFIVNKSIQVFVNFNYCPVKIMIHIADNYMESIKLITVILYVKLDRFPKILICTYICTISDIVLLPNTIFQYHLLEIIPIITPIIIIIYDFI